MQERAYRLSRRPRLHGRRFWASSARDQGKLDAKIKQLAPLGTDPEVVKAVKAHDATPASAEALAMTNERREASRRGLAIMADNEDRLPSPREREPCPVAPPEGPG